MKISRAIFFCLSALLSIELIPDRGMMASREVDWLRCGRVSGESFLAKKIGEGVVFYIPLWC